MICVVRCFENGGFPPFFVLFWVLRCGEMGGTGRFCWAGAVLCCLYVVVIQTIVAMYVAHIVQIIKSLPLR